MVIQPHVHNMETSDMISTYRDLVVCADAGGWPAGRGSLAEMVPARSQWRPYPSLSSGRATNDHAHWIIEHCRKYNDHPIVPATLLNSTASSALRGVNRLHAVGEPVDHAFAHVLPDPSVFQQHRGPQCHGVQSKQRDDRRPQHRWL